MSRRKRRRKEGIRHLGDPEYRREVVGNTVAALVVVAIMFVIIFLVGACVILISG